MDQSLEHSNMGPMLNLQLYSSLSSALGYEYLLDKTLGIYEPCNHVTRWMHLEIDISQVRFLQ